MPLDQILAEIDKPIHPKAKSTIVNYMKNLPTQHDALALQCAEYLEKHDTLAAVLVVVHALNEQEFLLKCRDDDDLDADGLSCEMDRLLKE